MHALSKAHVKNFLHFQELCLCVGMLLSGNRLYAGGQVAASHFLWYFQPYLRQTIFTRVWGGGVGGGGRNYCFYFKLIKIDLVVYLFSGTFFFSCLDNYIIIKTRRKSTGELNSFLQSP